MDLKVVRPHATLKQQVVDNLRSAIVEMHLRPGRRLVERELCERMGVSRTLIREALSQLVAERLVEIIPHKGPIVAVCTAEEATGLYEVRAALEAMAGRAFVERATDAECIALERAFEEVKRVYRNKNSADRLAVKTRFYSVLLEGSRNPALVETLRLIHGRVTMLRATTLSQPGRLEKSLVELAEIVQAVKKRDAAAAARACRRHVENAAAVAAVTLAANRDLTEPVSPAEAQRR